MDPYTESLRTELARREPSYRVPQPRATRRPRTLRTSHWLRRRA